MRFARTFVEDVEFSTEDGTRSDVEFLIEMVKVAVQAGARLLEVELVCADTRQHRARIESRHSEIAGLVLPDWAAVLERRYEVWDRERLVVDTCTSSVEECVEIVVKAARWR